VLEWALDRARALHQGPKVRIGQPFDVGLADPSGADSQFAAGTSVSGFPPNHVRAMPSTFEFCLPADQRDPCVTCTCWVNQGNGTEWPLRSSS
jgi:hypothetical protein